jgi:hypothetical protein
MRLTRVESLTRLFVATGRCNDLAEEIENSERPRSPAGFTRARYLKAIPRGQEYVQ